MTIIAFLLNFSRRKLAVASRSGQRRAVLVEKQGAGDSSAKTEYLQIWSDSGLVKSYNLGELDLHKAVYTSGGWGITMAWNQSESKLAYLAEKKVPKSKAFYTSAAAPKPKEDSNSNEKKLKDESSLVKNVCLIKN